MEILERPRLRGVFHQYAFFVAVLAGAVLVLFADAGRERLAMLIYAIALAAMFGVSALYHRVTWSEGTRRWMRRLDHSMIFVLIAATLTPVAIMVLDDPLRTVLLAVAWGGALAGAFVELLWPSSPRWVVAGLCLAIGWAGAAAVPQMIEFAPSVLVLLAAGGVGAAAVVGATRGRAEREAGDAYGCEHPARRARGRNVTDVHGANSPLRWVVTAS